jgi:prepilin-type N-terminal cleavage/methylation domain-containing protein
MNLFLKNKKGFTLVELLIVIVIIMLITVFVYLSLFRRKGFSELYSTRDQIVALLREAQNNAISQNKDSEWGVYFSNLTSTSSFYSLFYGTIYSTSTSLKKYNLPTSVQYNTSTIPTGSSLTIYFNKITGISSTSTSIILNFNLSNQTIASSTININQSGLISFN